MKDDFDELLLRCELCKKSRPNLKMRVCILKTLGRGPRFCQACRCTRATTNQRIHWAGFTRAPVHERNMPNVKMDTHGTIRR